MKQTAVRISLTVITSKTAVQPVKTYWHHLSVSWGRLICTVDVVCCGNTFYHIFTDRNAAVLILSHIVTAKSSVTGYFYYSLLVTS